MLSVATTGAPTVAPDELDRVAVGRTSGSTLSSFEPRLPTLSAASKSERNEGLEAYAVLRGLPTQEVDGATTYVAEPEEPASAVVCVACGTTFLLSLRHPGAFCGCGDLHWLKLRYDGSLGRVIPMTETLYRDGINPAGPGDEPNLLAR